MLEASHGYASLMSSDKAPAGCEKWINCTAGVAAVAATSMLAMLQVVSRPRIATCDQSQDCTLRSARVVRVGLGVRVSTAC